MPITQRNKIGMLEAMLFANAEPVETDRLAEAMRADPAEVLTLLEKLQKRYDETESGLMLLHFALRIRRFVPCCLLFRVGWVKRQLSPVVQPTHRRRCSAAC